MSFKSMLSKFRSAIDGAQRDLTELRDRISDLQAKRQAIADAPATYDEIAAKVDVAIKRARADEPMRFRLLEEPGRQLHPVDFNQKFKEKPFELLASLAPEQLREALLDGMPKSGMTSEDRTAQLAKIDGELFATEAAEESALRELEAATGGTIPRRPDANPQILLAPDNELSG